MSLGQHLIDFVEHRRDRHLRRAAGPVGDYYRHGGNELLYDLPVNTGGLVIDAGGYHGDWTARMISQYGCRSVIFEPIPAYAEMCQKTFARNGLVSVRAEALGGAARTTAFSIASDGSSEFRATKGRQISAPVADIYEVLGDQLVDCLKLNIEGGEYEVLERLVATHKASQCRSLLIQFHRQPEGWEHRRSALEKQLANTHRRDWCYPMVWEKWTARNIVVEPAVLSAVPK